MTGTISAHVIASAWDSAVGAALHEIDVRASR